MLFPREIKRIIIKYLKDIPCTELTQQLEKDQYSVQYYKDLHYLSHFFDIVDPLFINIVLDDEPDLYDLYNKELTCYLIEDNYYIIYDEDEW